MPKAIIELPYNKKGYDALDKIRILVKRSGGIIEVKTRRY